MRGSTRVAMRAQPGGPELSVTGKAGPGTAPTSVWEELESLPSSQWLPHLSSPLACPTLAPCVQT